MASPVVKDRVGSRDKHEQVRVGTAGWSIPREQAARFPGAGAHLVRYGSVLGCAEINSSFYRSPRASTYERWAQSTPEAFRFSVKVPKAITHECGLAPTKAQVERFLDEVKPLRGKLGPLLLQLPPKQGFVEDVARTFLGLLRECSSDAAFVIEPRNAGWFTDEAVSLLREFEVSTVLADPPPRGVTVPDATGRMAYFRLHGSPRVYYSSYGSEYLEALSERIRLALGQGVEEVWCIFDNTASGAALGNAVDLMDRLSSHGVRVPGVPEAGGTAG